MPEGPDYRGRSPEQIISERVYFDSVGYTFRALSWLDVAKRARNVCALQYAAHDTRQAIEHLLFEEIVLGVGTNLDQTEYLECKGNGTKLHKILRRLNPDYARLARFTQAIVSLDSTAPSIIAWDHRALMKHWGIVSNYLHWAGAPAETVESETWVDDGLVALETAAAYIWDNNRAGSAGIMLPDNMQPEIRDCWERFRAGDIDLDTVKRIGRIALPILIGRLQTRGGL